MNVAAIRLEQVEEIEMQRETGKSLAQIFEACGVGLYRFILVRVSDRHTADDLLQQTCCIAAGHRSPPTDEGACEAWLRGIARNLVRKHWRDCKRSNNHIPMEDAELSRQLAEDMETRPLPPEVLTRKELVEQLMLAITTLPTAEQSLLFDFYFNGRSQSGMAADRHTTLKSIEAKLYRARQSLRAIMNNPERTNES